MAFSSSGSSSLSCTPNVTPLIDVLLVLLIIFMVIVPVSPRGLEDLIPTPSQASEPVSELAPVLLEVKRASHGLVYHLDGREVTLQQVRAALRECAARRAGSSLVIAGDPALDYGTVAGLVGEAKAVGFQNIGLLPRPRV